MLSGSVLSAIFGPTFGTSTTTHCEIPLLHRYSIVIHYIWIILVWIWLCNFDILDILVTLRRIIEINGIGCFCIFIVGLNIFLSFFIFLFFFCTWFLEQVVCFASLIFSCLSKLVGLFYFFICSWWLVKLIFIDSISYISSTYKRLWYFVCSFLLDLLAPNLAFSTGNRCIIFLFFKIFIIDRHILHLVLKLSRPFLISVLKFISQLLFGCFGQCWKACSILLLALTGSIHDSCSAGSVSSVEVWRHCACRKLGIHCFRKAIFALGHVCIIHISSSHSIIILLRWSNNLIWLLNGKSISLAIII